jgi:hypothetical protein
MPDQDDPCDDWSGQKIPDSNKKPAKETKDD